MFPFVLKKDEMDWEECGKETSCFRILQESLFATNAYYPSPCVTDIKHISDDINKVM